MSVSELLKRAIKDSGLSLHTLERETGIPRCSLTRFLRGDMTLKLSSADRLAEHLGFELRPAEATAAKGRRRKGK